MLPYAHTLEDKFKHTTTKLLIKYILFMQSTTWDGSQATTSLWSTPTSVPLAWHRTLVKVPHSGGLRNSNGICGHVRYSEIFNTQPVSYINFFFFNIN